MREFGWTGRCPDCGTRMGLELEPTDGFANAIMVDPERLTEMFNISGYCQICERVVEVEGVRAKP